MSLIGSNKTKYQREYMRKRRQKSVTQGGALQGSVTVIGHNIRGRVIEVDTRTAAKLLLICQSLNRETRELSGRKSNLLGHVRYGGCSLAEAWPKLGGADAVK